jgi:hypothetical protein
MRMKLGLIKNGKHKFFCGNLKEKRGRIQEARDKRQEVRSERQETSDSLPTGRQETRGKSREEIELFAVRFLCACLPQEGLCAFASKKKKEKKGKRQEARDKRQEIELFAVRFLCVSAPLRAKRKKNQETRSKRNKSRFLPAYRRQDSCILLLLFKFLFPRNKERLPFHCCLIHHKQGIFLSNAARRDAWVLLDQALYHFLFLASRHDPKELFGGIE